MIVGTAGHIDHGKTTLVRALTGVDTDRLPEEKKRGISIELGYAFLDVPGGAKRIGFVDVPGHERLVHTMLAGATGIDFALLLVAADDGVMPQTREHFAVLCLMEMAHGAVVITKCDRVGPERLAAVRTEVAALVGGTPWADAPLLPVAAPLGVGLGTLKSLLFDTASKLAEPRSEEAGFRLAIDRLFTLSGVGTVATGSIHAGRVQLGDELARVPPRNAPTVRVRSLHAQNSAADSARAGERCALGLAGLAKDEAARGQWLCALPIALITERIDVRLTLWRDEPQPLRSGTTVHLHLGASDVLARVALLDADWLDAGASALAQLVLQGPIAAWHGDHVVLRDASASRTLAGGRVLDPLAPARYRRTPQRLAMLAAWELPTASTRLAALLASAPLGLDVQAWARAEGRVAPPPDLPAGCLLGSAAGADWALAPMHAEALQASLIARLKAIHAEQPDELGPDAARLRRWLAPRLPSVLWRTLLARAIANGDVRQRGTQLHLPEHGVQLSALDQRIAQKLMPALVAGGFDPPWVRTLAATARESEALVRTVMERLAQRGELHQIVKDLYYAPEAVTQLAGIARKLAACDGEVRAAAFRDATGLGRKRAIQVLEFFDRVGLLQRVQDAHRLRRDTMLFEGQGA